MQLNSSFPLRFLVIVFPPPPFPSPPLLRTKSRYTLYISVLPPSCFLHPWSLCFLLPGQRQRKLLLVPLLPSPRHPPLFPLPSSPFSLLPLAIYHPFHHSHNLTQHDTHDTHTHVKRREDANWKIKRKKKAQGTAMMTDTINKSQTRISISSFPVGRTTTASSTTTSSSRRRSSPIIIPPHDPLHRAQ